MKPTFEELKKAAEPLIELIGQSYNPYTSIVVSIDAVEVVQTIARTPLEIKD